MDRILLELFRHKTWATLELIALCKTLPDDVLEAAMPGTYGSVRETLRHLVASEEGYFWTVTGEQIGQPLPLTPVPLEELEARVRRLGPRWEALVEDPARGEREVTTRDGWRTLAAVPMAQAVHHADEHRVQILSMLGARGVVVPELGVWDYAQQAGHMRLVGFQPG